jgi:heme/copper-type cytochrome/quinol oxidase subunit 3
MHGVHFIVALLFVAFVFLQGLANRYDHEYSWGVTFCAWFWHALGIIWLVIVAGFVIAAFAPV